MKQMIDTDLLPLAEPIKGKNKKILMIKIFLNFTIRLWLLSSSKIFKITMYSSWNISRYTRLFIIVIKINNMKYSNVQMDFILIRNYSCVQHLNWFVYWIEILTRNFSFRSLQINCQYEPPMVSTITDDEIDTTSTIESGHFLIDSII